MNRMHLWEVVVDCADPASLCRFYAELCGCEPNVRESDWAYIEPAGRGLGHEADAGGVRIAFQRVPEPKVGKVRLHLDLGCEDLVEGTRRAVELGATVIGASEDHADRFIVLTDPEGHEFCLVEP